MTVAYLFLIAGDFLLKLSKVGTGDNKSLYWYPKDDGSTVTKPRESSDLHSSLYLKVYCFVKSKKKQGSNPSIKSPFSKLFLHSEVSKTAGEVMFTKHFTNYKVSQRGPEKLDGQIQTLLLTYSALISKSRICFVLSC